MKVIDLLNKIANGEKLPNKIKYGKLILEKIERSYGEIDYVNNEGYNLGGFLWLHNLNDEIEIIEEDKPIEIKQLKTYSDYEDYEDWKKEISKTDDENYKFACRKYIAEFRMHKVYCNRFLQDLKQLKELGYIDFQPKQSRTIVIKNEM